MLSAARSILESRLIDARTQLSYAQKRLEKYQEMGPEFETLAGAYFKLLEDIQATQDDIDRIKRDWGRKRKGTQMKCKYMVHNPQLLLIVAFFLRRSVM